MAYWFYYRIQKFESGYYYLNNLNLKLKHQTVHFTVFVIFKTFAFSVVFSINPDSMTRILRKPTQLRDSTYIKGQPRSIHKFIKEKNTTRTLGSWELKAT